MSYIASQIRAAALTIAGTSYLNNLVSWRVSDSSAFSSGLISTSGELRLSGILGGALMEDYDRDNFQRGAEVILTITMPDGTSVRHPRGLLYVIGNGYDVESEQTIISIGCKIALATLIDDPTDLLSFATVPLDETQKTVSGVGGSLSTAGQYLYQKNDGVLTKGTWFESDNDSSTGAGDWVSILGTTALSVQPLQGSGAIPDQINLSYNVPLSFTDTPPTVDINTTESYYFLTYPVVKYVRTGDGLGSITNVTDGTIVDSTTTGNCGNTPSAPDNSQQTPGCNEGYSLQSSPVFLPAERTVVSRTEYNGPAGQVSRTLSTTTGPIVEANNQYFADKYAYCRYIWSTRCQPNGACSTDDGMVQRTLGYTETLNFYGTANELVKQIVDTYTTTLSGAQPFDWRSGVVNGAPQDFSDLSTTDLYRVSRVETIYYKSGDSNVQESTTYTSMTSRGVGIKQGNIDALSGIKTFEKRTSTTISATPLAPDATQSPQTATKTLSTIIPLIRLGYTEPPNSGPYIQQSQAPVSMLFTTQAAVDANLKVYKRFLKKATLGDAYGLQIAEALRKDIVTGWHPGMPFRYYDNRPGTSNDKLMAMRMDACVWGLDAAEGAQVVTNGVWIGYSNGTVTMPVNVQGTGETQVAASVSNETVVNTGSIAFFVDVQIPNQSTFKPVVDTVVFKPADSEYTINEHKTFTVWTTGFVVGPNSLAEVGPNGTNPTTNDGDLLLTTATVVTQDLFTGYTSNSGAD